MPKDKKVLTTEVYEDMKKAVSDVLDVFLDASKMDDLEKRLVNFLKLREDLSIEEQQSMIDDLQSQPAYRNYREVSEKIFKLKSEQESMINDLQDEELKHYKDNLDDISKLNAMMDQAKSDLKQLSQLGEQLYAGSYEWILTEISCLCPITKERYKKLLENKIDITNESLNICERQIERLKEGTASKEDVDRLNQDLELNIEYINKVYKLFNLSDTEKDVLKHLKDGANALKEQFIAIQGEISEREEANGFRMKERLTAAEQKLEDRVAGQKSEDRVKENAGNKKDKDNDLSRD